MELTLQGLKPLTTIQYDDARARALKRVKDRIGEKPTKKNLKREQASLFSILDVLALLIFAGAFVVSSVHIAQHMHDLISLRAGASEDPIYTFVHQVAYILMAEFSLIMFLVMFASGKRGDARRWVFLILAALSLIFLFVANLASGVGVLESVLPPLFTVGIGFHLEGLIVKSLQRAKELDDRYQAAMNSYELASKDPEHHPDFIRFFRVELWGALVAKNKAYADAPNGFKAAAVSREMERETWAHDGQSLVTTFSANGHGDDPRPLALPLADMTPAAVIN